MTKIKSNISKRFEYVYIQKSKAAVQSCSWKKVFRNYAEHLYESTHAEV